MGWLYDKAAGLFLPAALIAAVVLAGLLGIQTVRVSSLKADLAGEQRDREKDRADAQETLRLAERRVAAGVQRTAIEQQRASDDFAKEREGLVADAVAARADADGLRADIAAFVRSARPVGPDAPPPAPASVDRGNQSATLGDLFGACAGRYLGLAQEADRLTAEQRAMKRQIKAERQACDAQ